AVPSFQELDPEDSFAQVLRPNGETAFSTSQIEGAALSAEELRAAAEDAVTLEREAVEGIDGRVRVLATPLSGSDESLIAVAGATLEDRDESLQSLALVLLIGGPLALMLSAAAGYLVAGRALSPVERLRSEAAAIGGSEPDARLAVPGPDDELRRLALTLNEMLGRLEGAIERERRLVDDASHELRTPLALHKTELEVAQRYATSEEELRAAIASGIEEVDRLARLADDLLVVARSGEAGPPVRDEEIDAASLLGTVVARLRDRATNEGREIRIEAPPGLSLRGDRVRLEQALTNMADNALRHGEGTVTLAAAPRTQAVRLEVTDQGSGWAPEFVPRAFERFSRGDSAREGEGAGLGLAIVEAIAEAHGGVAGADEAPGGGAAVWIDLPSAEKGLRH
ncbi:MAG: ATP-binding protein, partial [Actinomycetota bacterium]|nr:ATP-binding protein [Actinomycetota bacterium]